MGLPGRIYVAGHRGLVGSAIVRRLEEAGAGDLVLRTSRELDLREQSAVRDFFRKVRPQWVFLAAARVGGILANASRPAEFIRDNLAIQVNVIHEAWASGVEKLLFLGSSCIYPRDAGQPMAEEALLTGPLESTNECYAVAKIAGIKLCQAYWRQYGFKAISLMPTNLYGPGDNFHPTESHVIPGLIRRFHEAREPGAGEVRVWGTGEPRREFLYVDDLADAALFLMERHQGEEIINVGLGRDISIRELARTIARVVGFKGEIFFDPGKPDGTPRKLLDVSRLESMGWRAATGLEEGLARTYRWFLDNQV